MPLRHPGIDRLKVAVTALVVFHHAAITYGGPGGWFWRDPGVPSRSVSDLLGIFCAVNQSFFMGLFFLMAGAHVPAALRDKGGWRFMRDRLLRLGVPLLVFGLVLGPITVALAQTTKGHAVTTTLAWAWRTGAFYPGPLWFATALLAMSALAALRTPRFARERRPMPGHGILLAAALACGTVAFALRLVWPVGWSVWGLQLGYFASYVLLFAAGIHAAEQGWWLHVPDATARRWRTVTWCALPFLGLGFIPLGLGDPMGGWNVAAVVYAFWEPLVAWGILLTLLARAQRHTRPPGPLGAAMARRAFATYVIHPPVLVALGLLGRDLPWPALVKFAVAGSLGCVLCFVIAGLLLRVPGVARVL